MTSSAFDFRKPPPGELERQLSKWLNLAAREATAIWTRLLPFPTEVNLGPVSGMTAGQSLNGLSDDAIGLPFHTTAPADGTALFAIPRPCLLGLIAGLLGETPTTLPVDRSFTEVESSLIDYFTQELLLAPLVKTWPGLETLPLKAGTPGTPRAVWRVPGGDSILYTVFLLSTPFGDQQIHLLMPRLGRWEQMAASGPLAQPVSPAPRAQLEGIVKAMAVDLAVVLGTANLTMRELTQLKSGDLVVLRQKVTQPLDGLVGGTRKFKVWPGVVGSRSAVVIHAPAEE